MSLILTLNLKTKEANVELGLHRGQQLKGIPKHMYSLRTVIVSGGGWNNHVVLTYIDETCVNLGCNNSDDRFNKSQDLTVIDWISHYAFSEELNFFLKVENILNKQKIISRTPAGARSNRPRTLTLGMRYNF